MTRIAWMGVLVFCLGSEPALCLQAPPDEGRRAERERDARDADRRPLREALSDNERFHLRLAPGRSSGRSTCRARLSARDERGRRERMQWSGRLANSVAPVHAHVSDDGRRLVTLDDFRRGGAQNALAVYSERGRKLRVFGLKELLRADDWLHVRLRDDAVVWLDDAEFSFEGVSRQFVVRLAWGREIRIELRAAELVGPQPGAADLAAIPAEISDLLAAPTRDVTDTDALRTAALEEFARRRAEIPLDDADALAALKAEFRDLLGALDAVEAQPEDPDAQEALAVLAEAFGLPHAEAVATEPDADIPESVSAAPPVEPGSPPPLPNADEYVDYIGWANEFTAVDGPSAAPFYEALIGALAEPAEADVWDLVSAAASGDPDALADPRTAEFVAQNAEALSLLQTATEYPYEGWPLESQDGTMIGALLPSLSAVRQTARLAVVEGRLLAEQGNTAEALDQYASVLENAAQTGRGVTLIERLVGVAVGASASDAVLDALGAGDAEVDYAEIADRLEAANQPMRSVDEIMEFERAMVLDLMQRSFARDDAGNLVSTPDRLWYLAYASADDSDAKRMQNAAALNALGFDGTVAAVNGYYDRLRSAMAGPAAAATAALTEMEQEFESGNPPVAPLQELVPALSRATISTARGDAGRRAAITAARIKAYQQQFGVLPDSLDALGISESMIDPFTNQPFVYRRDGDDFVLYSVGGNGIDEGGASSDERNPPDIRYWPRPAKSAAPR